MNIILNNLLQDPDDNTIIIQHLQETSQMHPDMGESCTRGSLLSEGMKINRQRLRNILKTLNKMYANKG